MQKGCLAGYPVLIVTAAALVFFNTPALADPVQAVQAGKTWSCAYPDNGGLTFTLTGHDVPGGNTWEPGGGGLACSHFPPKVQFVLKLEADFVYDTTADFTFELDAADARAKTFKWAAQQDPSLSMSFRDPACSPGTCQPHFSTQWDGGPAQPQGGPHLILCNAIGWTDALGNAFIRVSAPHLWIYPTPPVGGHVGIARLQNAKFTITSGAPISGQCVKYKEVH